MLAIPAFISSAPDKDGCEFCDTDAPLIRVKVYREVDRTLRFWLCDDCLDALAADVRARWRAYGA